MHMLLDWVSLGSFVLMNTYNSIGSFLHFKNVCIIKATVFPLVMYGCASWSIKKAESAKELMFSNYGTGEDSWEFMDRKESNQSILKEINPEYSLEGLMLKLQYFEHLMQIADSLEKTQMLERLKAKGEGMAKYEMVREYHLLSGREFEQTLGDGEGQRSLVCDSPWSSKKLVTT